MFFPTCQVRVVRFYQTSSPPPPAPPLLLTTGPQLKVPDRSRHYIQDPNFKCQIAVGAAGPQPPAPDRRGHYRIATASSTPQWAVPDPNCKCQIRSGHHSSQRHVHWCRTDGAESSAGHLSQKGHKFDLPKRLPPDDLYEPTAEAASEAGNQAETNV